MVDGPHPTDVSYEFKLLVHKNEKQVERVISKIVCVCVRERERKRERG